jgi:8-oxo-dGTP pyrophosphatase MutT (NUDIX family)
MHKMFDNWRGFLLVEGRKENAAAMLVKKIDDPELRDILQTEVLDEIIAADPTSNKKYVEWAARRIGDIARKEIDDQFLQKYAAAQRDPDGFTPGGPARGGPLDPEGRQPLTYDAEKLKRIKSMSRQDRFSAGYLTNAERLDSDRGAVRSIVFAKLQSLRSRLPIYHKAAQRGLIDKNIDKFKELYDWEHQVYKAEQEMYERDHMKKIEKGAKENTDYLHDDDDYMIVRPRSADSSCYYGKGTKWCISSTQSRNYFDQYTGEGVGFYFVLFKHLTQEDPYKKMALVFRPGEDEPSEVYDAVDDDVGVDAVRDAVEANIFGSALKVALADRIKWKKKNESPRDAQQYLANNIEAAQGAYTNLEDHLDNEQWSKAEWGRTKGGEDWQKNQVQRRVLGQALKEMGLDEGSLDVAMVEDIQEHVSELVDEQYYDIIGQGAGHYEDNPAGPTDADFDALMERHKYDYVYVSYDEYEPGRMYWDGGFSLDVTDIHEDLDGADLDEVENVLRQLLDNNNVFPDEFDSYGNDISIRFSPDYDENEGLNGFENFLNRMDDTDQALHRILESELKDTINALKDAGLLSGDTVKSLKERFDELELDNFEIDIEENELSIYTRLDITVPIPAHMYQGLTAGVPDWTAANRADITKSKSLQAFDAMLKQRQTEHSDQLIDHISNAFDKVFKLYANKLQSALPGFEREAPERETTGLIIPDYNVGLYRTAHKTEIGPSGLLTPYFFDVRIEADEEESLQEPNLKLIELFLKRIDNDVMIEKLKDRLEVIVQNDAIKNIIPNFKKGQDGPEIDPRTGKVTSPEEREVSKTADEIDRLAFSGRSAEREDLQEYMVRTAGDYGSRTMRGDYAAAGGHAVHPKTAAMSGMMQNWRDFKDGAPAPGEQEDSDKVVKAVLHRNGKVLLLLKQNGKLDLPGGHLYVNEADKTGLAREVQEETGLVMNEMDFQPLDFIVDNVSFFEGAFPRDDINTSPEEHKDHGFYSLQQIQQMKNIKPKYKKAISMALGEIQ